MLKTMPSLHISPAELSALLMKLNTLGQSERAAIEKTVHDLSRADGWYPLALRRELKKLHEAGLISEIDRHAVEQAFFPGKY
jgi:hypothetical protein